MPTISVFYGICIMMYLRNKEHNPPHIHASYGNEAASFYISNGEIYEGSFPARAKKMVKEFVLKYQKELLEMWETEKYIKLKGLD
jgi:hypothetical protein